MRPDLLLRLHVTKDHRENLSKFDDETFAKFPVDDVPRERGMTRHDQQCRTYNAGKKRHGCTHTDSETYIHTCTYSSQ